MTEIEVALRDKNMTLPDARRLLESNLEDVKKMNSLSNYLLKLNKLGNGSIKPEFKQVDLKIIAQDAVDKVSALARASKIDVTQKLENVNITGNTESLTELVTILLDNAIKYSGKGGKVIIKTSQHKLLSVQDFGVGISKEDIPHIFDRFYRADSSRSKGDVDGYGLGLSIAKSIVDLHKAKINVKSGPGKGTIFTVIF